MTKTQNEQLKIAAQLVSLVLRSLMLQKLPMLEHLRKHSSFFLKQNSQAPDKILHLFQFSLIHIQVLLQKLLNHEDQESPALL